VCLGVDFLDGKSHKHICLQAILTGKMLHPRGLRQFGVPNLRGVRRLGLNDALRQKLIAAALNFTGSLPKKHP
jgi:hypothetical protein